MTKPTEEQIKALKPGDRVLVEAKIRGGSPIDDEGDVQLEVPFSGQNGFDFYASPEAIHSILPRRIKVGDRVRLGELRGLRVLHIADGRAWVRSSLIDDVRDLADMVPEVSS